MPEILVLALGGNAILTPKNAGKFEEQEANFKKLLPGIKKLSQKNRLVITHGNGPQVGNLLIQQEIAKNTIPPKPMEVCDAMTQGELGFLVQKHLPGSVAVVTQIIVDELDPAFKKPTKPIGPYYQTMTELNMVKEPEGWRRVVSSPYPKQIVEIKQIRNLVKAGFIVIACGGGGIPVIEKGKKKTLEGIEAVIDKDYASLLLAKQLKANSLIFFTDVKYVYHNYGKRGQKPIKKLTIKKAQQLIEDREVAAGSMKPKILAAIEFLKSGGRKVLITSNPRFKTGTAITK